MLLHHKQAKSQLVKKIYIAKLLATRQLSHVYTVDIPTKLRSKRNNIRTTNRTAKDSWNAAKTTRVFRNACSTWYVTKVIVKVKKYGVVYLWNGAEMWWEETRSSSLVVIKRCLCLFAINPIPSKAARPIFSPTTFSRHLFILVCTEPHIWVCVCARVRVIVTKYYFST